ncbi:hypothetical protein GGR56DRAFT_276035 [Xylariaceae sp. FL0804]|nr:hypothetical protein GGR56DRAFT_276035 [Xylariaceae sp. FL0804]
MNVRRHSHQASLVCLCTFRFTARWLMAKPEEKRKQRRNHFFAASPKTASIRIQAVQSWLMGNIAIYCKTPPQFRGPLRRNATYLPRYSIVRARSQRFSFSHSLNKQIPYRQVAIETNGRARSYPANTVRGFDVRKFLLEEDVVRCFKESRKFCVAAAFGILAWITTRNSVAQPLSAAACMELT